MMLKTRLNNLLMNGHDLIQNLKQYLVLTLFTNENNIVINAGKINKIATRNSTLFKLLVFFLYSGFKFFIIRIN